MISHKTMGVLFLLAAGCSVAPMPVDGGDRDAGHDAEPSIDAGCTCSLANATSSCSAAGCTIERCDDGFDDCNGDPSDGCEAPLNTLSDCSACGTACAITHATATCESGICLVATCEAGHDDCNLDESDGCETPLDTVTDCGACGTPCDLPASTASCATGSCTIASCDEGWSDCDGDATNGCEATAVRRFSTGFMSPTSTALPEGEGWTSPTNAFSSDDAHASVPHQGGCRCPLMALSWDGGTTYSIGEHVGPFGTADSIRTSASSLWGHAWTPTELGNTSFRLRVGNPSTLISQGYRDFELSIPEAAVIDGIEVRVEASGDETFTTFRLDHVQVNVHYSITGC